jgi:hypothetical protein
MSAIRLRLTAIVLIVLAMVGACALLPDGGLGTGSPGPGGLAYPDVCAAFGFSDNRCAKVVHELARQEAVDGAIPCSGEAPDGCASPVPSVDPAALGQAVALRIPSLDVASTTPVATRSRLAVRRSPTASGRRP